MEVREDTDECGPAVVKSCKHAESREEIFTIGDLLACWIVGTAIS